MQVTRLIKSGKIPAQRVGNSWVIFTNPNQINQVGLHKTTSLQTWAKAIKTKLNKDINVELTKDREIIYTKLHSLSLPHEKFIVYPQADKLTKDDIYLATQKTGLPFWISAVPNKQLAYLDRQAKLRLYNIDDAWDFIKQLPEKHNYKIIVIQYPQNPLFKGTALVSKSNKGIVEFVTGDRHYLLTRGFTNTDPLLFDSKKIVKFSKTVPQSCQKHIYKLIKNNPGHFEFQQNQDNNPKNLSFFDYTNQANYNQIDLLWQKLKDYYKHQDSAKMAYLYGLPSTPQKAITGTCVVTHHETKNIYQNIKTGHILVSDTIVPNMIDHLNKISAIILDLGGVTTHIAIILRQLNIPTIVGCKNATSKLKTGQKITLNANLGTVKLHS